VIETRLDIDWMLYKIVMNAEGGLTNLQRALSSWHNPGIRSVYDEIFGPVEEKIISQEAQDFPTLDTTPGYNDWDFFSM
jgi:hypothetical protein